jgi:predicted GNAT family acetyltransferase
VIAEWQIGEAIWRLLERRPGFASVSRSKSVVYRLDQRPELPSIPIGITARALTVDDYEVWEPVDRAFHEEEGLRVLQDAQRRRAGYAARANVSGWWGAFADGVLVSTACLNAWYRGVGQVGGVYTRPEWRRRGLAQFVMGGLMRDHDKRTGLREVVLFTAEQNLPARALYESMGFAERGRVGLLFGKWDDGTEGTA